MQLLNIHHLKYEILKDQELGPVAGLVIQAHGRLSFEDDLRLEACFTVFHSEPAC